MKDFRFRAPEEWKSALLTLREHAYFQLMRSVFGNIKTPFNKHRLVEDLAAFLSRREIQETIAAYIDERDHRVIAAIALLNEPAPGDLESFFTGEYSYAELHDILINLEERFIIYGFREEGIHRLALNPLLEPVLAPFVAEKGPLFPSAVAETLPVSDAGGTETDASGAVVSEAAASEAVKAAPGAGVLAFSPAPDDRIFAALLAFVRDEPEFFKAEGGLRKRILEEGKRIFPIPDLDRLTGGLLCLGLLRLEGTRLYPDWGRLAAFTGLSRRERLEYWAAGIYLHLRGDAASRYFPRGQIQALARFTHRFMGALAAGRLYPRKTLWRIAEIAEIEEQGELQNFRQGDKGPLFRVRGSADFEVLLEALEKMGLLIAVSPGYRRSGIGPEDAEPDSTRPKDAERPVIAMDTAFSCILYPEIGCADALALASFSSVRETGTAVRFEITRESVVRGFDRGLDAAAIVATLTRLSGKPADQNLVWTLKDWENRYSAVSLYQGTVLILSEDRRYLAGTEPLVSLVDRVLAPGVYLLRAGDQDEVALNLQKAGVDIVARPPAGIRTGSAPTGHEHPPFPGLEARRRGAESAGDTAVYTAGQGSGREPDPEKARLRREQFHSALGKLKLPAAEREELAARIDRRLIVSESQLAGTAVRSEKLEARNLDYVGKTLVAKQAISFKSPVEVLWPGTEGGINRVLGVPEALEKSAGETVLVLKVQGEAEPAEVVRIPIGKISLLRRIKKSLFME
ncbi:MAG: helicase-associated domain-containing protein [Treponema sp.]|jgi:hypothetical protein|nr:helicase-associated domain-containing protein [Treponema sp.]